MNEYRVGKAIVLQKDHDETPPIELPLEKPLWVTKKSDNNELVRAKQTPLEGLLRGIEKLLINKFRR